jgi:hypothetical protein
LLPNTTAMPRRRDGEEEPEVEPGEDEIQDDEEGPVGPEDPALKYVGRCD